MLNTNAWEKSIFTVHEDKNTNLHARIKRLLICSSLNRISILPSKAQGTSGRERTERQKTEDGKKCYETSGYEVVVATINSKQQQMPS